MGDGEERQGERGDRDTGERRSPDGLTRWPHHLGPAIEGYSQSLGERVQICAFLVAYELDNQPFTRIMFGADKRNVMASLKTDHPNRTPTYLSVVETTLPTPKHRKGIKDRPLFTHGNWVVRGSGQMGVVRLEFSGKKGDQQGYARVIFGADGRRVVQAWTGEHELLGIPRGLSTKILLHFTNHGR